MEKIGLILATDCGSTTTKARLFKEIDGEWRFLIAGEAPTTVEAPYEDVTMGVRNAVREIEELTGYKILSHDGSGIVTPYDGESGVDLYCTTSSAGGGLQMSVFGASRSITAESAERAALGGGAIVMDVVATADGTPLHEKIERTRHLRPDIVLLSGGTDGGAIQPVVQAAEILRLAEPKSRFGEEFMLPVIFAGNMDARGPVKDLLEDRAALLITDNLRPDVEHENTDPARNAIQEQFMEHVMSHAPGYDKLMTWTGVDIMPTPMGEGHMFQLLAKSRSINIIGVGLGGATTNVYSVYEGRYVRTVSANLGMSYSICNVLREAGSKNIMRWIPFEMSEGLLSNVLTNKMIRPTTIPETLDELVIEHAVARESLRLGFNHHKFLARGLRGVRPVGRLDDIMDRKVDLETYIRMPHVNMIGGTGGLLSHAPRRVQSMMILIDGFQPQGVTSLVQDSVFMMPHLGVLSTVHPDIALNIFDRDCLVPLGNCIAPEGPIMKRGEESLEEEEIRDVVKVELVLSDGDTRTEDIKFGDLKRIPVPVGSTAEVTATPSLRYDMGEGLGKAITRNIGGGVVGVIIDARGRPLVLPDEKEDRKKKLIEWFTGVDMYPMKELSEVEMEI